MKEINVKGTARAAFGKKAAREIRKANAVPCNLYGEAKDENGAPVALPFTVTNDELRNLIYSPDIYAVNLNIDGKECKAILKEIQFHPVKDNVLHVDFYEITDTKPIVMEVPIKLNGLAEGVKAGGRLAAMAGITLPKLAQALVAAEVQKVHTHYGNRYRVAEI